MKRKAVTLICFTLALVALMGACVMDGASAPTPSVPTITATVVGEFAPPAATLDAGPYFDEVTDPDFTGYPEIEHCPITDDEVIMLAKVMYAEAQVVYWRGTQYGVSYQARQAAVGWIALNRLDAGTYGDTLAEILSKPAQFAYSPDTPVTDAMMELARDVVDRWWNEQLGYADVGRTIPADYFYFEGDGSENHFRKAYKGDGWTWDWSLPDPYLEG